MADNQIVIKLRIDDKGNLKKASSQTEKLSKSTDKATRSTDRLQKSRDKYSRTEKGVAGISSNSTKNFSNYKSWPVRCSSNCAKGTSSRSSSSAISLII